jgi:cell division protein FtsZ
LRDTAEAVVCLEGDALFQTMGGTVSDAFRHVDEVIAESLSALLAISRGGGAMPVDFSHLRTLLRKRDAECRIALAAAAGEGLSARLAAELKAFPMVAGSQQLETCDAALLSLSAAADLSMSTANECITAIKAAINPRAEVLVGLATQAQPGSVQAVLLLIRYAKGKSPSLHGAKPPQSRRHKTHSSRSGIHESADNLQGELELQELNAGAFSKSLKPTLWDGQNLDIPTWQRKGIKIENE